MAEEENTFNFKEADIKSFLDNPSIEGFGNITAGANAANVRSSASNMEESSQRREMSKLNRGASTQIGGNLHNALPKFDPRYKRSKLNTSIGGSIEDVPLYSNENVGITGSARANMSNLIGDLPPVLATIGGVNITFPNSSFGIGVDYGETRTLGGIPSNTYQTGNISARKDNVFGGTLGANVRLAENQDPYFGLTYNKRY